MKKVNTTHYLIKIKELGDNRGGMAVIEGLKDIPFEIRRLFYIYNTTGGKKGIRGNHANKNSKFCLVSITGSCCIEVDDGYSEKKEYILKSPLEILFIDKMVWKTMYNFTKDNVLLVLSSHNYDDKEYIRNYQNFKLLTQKEVL